MRWNFSRRLIGYFMFVAASLACAAPAEHYARWPEIDNVAISPSGTRLALIAADAKGVRQLVVMDLDPIGKPRVVGRVDGADVLDANWVNDERLVFSAAERSAVVREGSQGLSMCGEFCRGYRSELHVHDDLERPARVGEALFDASVDR